MKIKRYLDKDMRHVLRRVREDQGPEAVILSNRRVEDGIEVIAAVDYDEALVRHAIGMEADPESKINSDALAEIAEDDIEVPATPAPELISAELTPASFDDQSLKGMQDEITSLRGLLETQLSGLVWKDATQRSPLRAQMLRNLSRLGLAPDIANITVDRLEPVNDVKSLWHAPLSALAQSLPVTDNEILEQGGTYALIGPTGVGKTTTIAKIAARYAMTDGSDEIALISADSYRIGAKEHLMALANIIGSKVYSASTSDELTEVLTLLRNKRLVLIDTEGRSPRDRDLAHRLAAYGNSQERVKFYLTLSAATQEAALDEAVRQFKKVPIEGCIVTKIDEAAQLGCIISTLIRNGLPAAWFSDGQRIPDDLYSAMRKRMWLVNRAVECLELSEPQIDERVLAESHFRAGVANA